MTNCIHVSRLGFAIPLWLVIGGHWSDLGAQEDSDRGRPRGLPGGCRCRRVAREICERGLLDLPQEPGEPAGQGLRTRDVVVESDPKLMQVAGAPGAPRRLACHLHGRQ